MFFWIHYTLSGDEMTTCYNEIMKQKLTEKAISLWNRYGYNAVSINRICQECGVTKGSFYHHFRSKEDLLVVYLDDVFDKIGIPEETDGTIEEIFGLIVAITKPLTELDPDAVLALLKSEGNIPYDPHDSFFRQSKVYRKMISIGKEGQRKGTIRDSFPVEELIDVCLTLLTGNIRNWCVSGRSFDLWEEDRKDIDIILRK